MKKGASFLLFLVIIGIVAGLTAVSVGLISTRWRQQSPSGTAHTWVHSKLDITPQQEKSLAPIERNFSEQRRRLEEKMHQANVELAQAILDDGQQSERVNRAIESIHHHMGELQKATIGHVFAMQEILTPEQYKELLDLTANALRNMDAHSEHGGHD